MMTRLNLLGIVGLAVVSSVLCGCRTPQQRRQHADAPPKSEKISGDTDPLHPRVKIETSVGDIIVELNAGEAPNTVLNFIQYLQDDYYSGTIFHRVLKGSMIQGGGYTPDMELKLLGLKPAPDGAWSSHLVNERHTIAMIRGQAKGGAGSAQFFINLADNTHLDESLRRGLCAVFGRVVDGFDTLERISNSPVGIHAKYAEGRSSVVPVKPIIIKSVRLLSEFHPVRIQAAAMALKAREDDRLGVRVAEIEQETGAKAVTTDSGLRYVDIIVGTGNSPVVGDEIEFHYRGKLLDGTEFESTYGKDAAVRPVANLIPGLQEGLATMREGGRRILVIPPELGFRGHGIPGLIPPDAALVFELDLIEIR